MRKQARQGHISFLGLCFALFLWGCQPAAVVEDGLPAGGLLSGEWAFVLGRSDLAGAYGAIDWRVRKPYRSLGSASNDAIARLWGERLYIINRFTHDNIQVLDARDLRLIRQYSVGVGSNPQDLVVVGSKAYVSALGHPSIRILQPETGEKIGEIDLAALSERSEKPCQSDGVCEGERCIEGFCARDSLPELAGMHLYAGRWLFVLAQRLDRYQNFFPVAKGKIAIIDTESDQWVETLETASTNPLYLAVEPEGEELFVGQVGEWMGVDGKPRLDGVIERFSMRERRSLGVILREEELGGNIGSFAMLSRTKGFVIRTGESWQTELVSFSLQGDAVTIQAHAASPCLAGISCFGFVQVVRSPRGDLALLDRYERKAGIRIFDALGQEQTAEPIDLGLPPDFLIFSTDAK